MQKWKHNMTFVINRNHQPVCHRYCQTFTIDSQIAAAHRYFVKEFFLKKYNVFKNVSTVNQTQKYSFKIFDNLVCILNVAKCHA